MSISSLKPAVSTCWLLALAGLLWSGVGVMLCRLAYGWLPGIGWNRFGALGLGGVLLSVPVYWLGFVKIARKNIDRLCRFPEKTCLFAFQSWKSYLLIAFMVSLGLAFRHSAFPKRYLAVIYTTIGGALILSSFLYYARIWSIMALGRPCRSVGSNAGEGADETPKNPSLSGEESH